MAVALVALTAGIIYTLSSRHSSASAARRTLYDEQISFHESRVRKNPDDPEVRRRFAAALNARAEATGNGEDYDLALSELDKAEELAPGSLDLLAARAATLLSRHRFAEARATAEEGLKRKAESPDFIGIAGDGALQTGDLEAADSYYRRLTELEPKKAASWSRLSQLAELRGDLNEAAALMEKAINAGYPKPLTPLNTAWARSILGEIELKRGNAAEARRQYMWALDKSPDHPLALHHLAQLDEREGRLDAAEAGFRKVLENRPSDPDAKLGLSRLLEARGEKVEAKRLRAEAVRFYEEAVESGNEGYLRPLAQQYLKDGRHAEAVELAARDLKLRPTLESRLIHESMLKAARDGGEQTAAR